MSVVFDSFDVASLSGCINNLSNTEINNFLCHTDFAFTKHIFVQYLAQFHCKKDDVSGIDRGRKAQDSETKVFADLRNMVKDINHIQNGNSENTKLLINSTNVFCSLPSDIGGNIVSFVRMKERLSTERISRDLRRMAIRKNARHHLLIDKVFIKEILFDKIDIRKFYNCKCLEIDFVFQCVEETKSIYGQKLSAKYISVINEILFNSFNLQTIIYAGKRFRFSKLHSNARNLRRRLPLEMIYRYFMTWIYSLLDMDEHQNYNPMFKRIFNNVTCLKIIHPYKGQYITDGIGIHDKRDKSLFLSLFTNVKSFTSDVKINPGLYNRKNDCYFAFNLRNDRFWTNLEILSINVNTKCGNIFTYLQSMKKLRELTLGWNWELRMNNNNTYVIKNLRKLDIIFYHCRRLHPMYSICTQFFVAFPDITEYSFRIEKYGRFNFNSHVIPKIFQHLQMINNIRDLTIDVNSRLVKYFMVNCSSFALKKLRSLHIIEFYDFKSYSNDLEIVPGVNSHRVAPSPSAMLNLESFHYSYHYNYVRNKNNCALHMLKLLNNMLLPSVFVSLKFLRMDCCPGQFQFTMNKKYSKEICQVLTRMSTVYPNIETIDLEDIRIREKGITFLKFWFCEEYGSCEVIETAKKGKIKVSGVLLKTIVTRDAKITDV